MKPLAQGHGQAPALTPFRLFRATTRTHHSDGYPGDDGFRARADEQVICGICPRSRRTGIKMVAWPNLKSLSNAWKRS
jgi:hypothetical protein